MPISSFGKDGVVDLKLDDDQVMDPVTGEIGLHATPIVAGNTVIIGAAHLSGSVPRSKANEKGYIRGFDVKTGKRMWIFHTIPQSGEFGNDTWEKDSWVYTGNTGVWGQISVDEELGMAYLPVELPTGDYYGGHRPGNNLFGESIVAVDLKTGQRKWHFQLVHHGIWDFDIPCAPILADITVNGRTVKALAQPTKQAFLYVFDRVTGKPIWPIEERPVEKGDVPGEWYSPTQPFPLDAHGKPFAYDRNGFSHDDLIDFTPELRAEGEKVISKYKIGPVFTPPVVSKVEGPLGTLPAGDQRWRHRVGGWVLRSRDPHHVRVFAQVAELARPRQAGSREERHELRPGQRAHRRAGRRPRWVRPPDGLRRDCVPRGECAGAPRRRRRGRRRGWRPATHGSGPADREAAVRQHQRDQPGQGRDPVADRARRHAGQRPESPRAEGAHHPAHGPGWHHRDAGHQDAASSRARRRRRRRATRAARCCARTTRPPARTPARCSCRRSRPARR